jgi:hypothetical protein
MKILMTGEKMIKGKLREAGDTVIVNKELGERLISAGMANRIVGDAENRLIGPGRKRFGPKRFHN